MNIRALVKSGIPTASADGLLARMQDKVDGLMGLERRKYPGTGRTKRGMISTSGYLNDTGFFICSVTHEGDLHARSFHYANAI
jgi:hypothetical protein